MPMSFSNTNLDSPMVQRIESTQARCCRHVCYEKGEPPFVRKIQSLEFMGELESAPESIQKAYYYVQRFCNRPTAKDRLMSQLGWWKNSPSPNPFPTACRLYAVAGGAKGRGTTLCRWIRTSVLMVGGGRGAYCLRVTITTDAKIGIKERENIKSASRRTRCIYSCQTSFANWFNNRRKRWASKNTGLKVSASTLCSHRRYFSCNAFLIAIGLLMIATGKAVWLLIMPLYFKVL